MIEWGAYFSEYSKCPCYFYVQIFCDTCNKDPLFQYLEIVMVLLLLAGVEEAQGEHTPALLHYVIISIFSCSQLSCSSCVFLKQPSFGECYCVENRSSELSYCVEQGPLQRAESAFGQCIPMRDCLCELKKLSESLNPRSLIQS